MVGSVRGRLVMYSKCFRQLDLDGNLIGELGGYEIMRALTKREQRMTCLYLYAVGTRKVFTEKSNS